MTTAEILAERERLASVIWESFKELYNRRPRNMDFTNMDLHDLRREANRIEEALAFEEELEAREAERVELINLENAFQVNTPLTHNPFREALGG